MQKKAVQDVTLGNSSLVSEKARADAKKSYQPGQSIGVLRPRRTEAVRYYPEERRRTGERTGRPVPENIC